MNYIIIEPSKLGEETARWITVGNCLHKTSVIAGVAGMTAGLVWPDRGLVYFPMCFLSTVCAGVYMISWQFDPCCKYQVEYDTKCLQKLPLQKLTSSSPVVLMRTRRHPTENPTYDNRIRRHRLLCVEILRLVLEVMIRP